MSEEGFDIKNADLGNQLSGEMISDGVHVHPFGDDTFSLKAVEIIVDQFLDPNVLYASGREEFSLADFLQAVSKVFLGFLLRGETALAETSSACVIIGLVPFASFSDRAHY